MCARFQFDEAAVEMAVSISETHNPQVWNLAAGDIHPSQPSVVIARHRDHLHTGIMTWGLPRYDGKGLIINTRSESAAEKTMFRESLQLRRCVIPARAFYEWDRQRQKITFTPPDQEVLWMAGIYDANYRYSVLTTSANDSVSRFHDRMPVLLSGEDLAPWLLDNEAIHPLLEKKMPALEHRQDNEQISLY